MTPTFSPAPGAAARAAPLAVAGGIECSVVRVADGWRDQLDETGHRRRAGDLRLLADAGLRALRYPILWEHVSPQAAEQCEWDWHDARLAELRALGVRVLAGLVHHGSGPAYTDLLAPGFAAGLAVHAGNAARRYPWVTRWAPVNEPLTTARFAGLYGHWHPGGTSEPVMLRMLAGQCRAALLAMQAIRGIIPDAEFVQTEDIGRVFSTDRLHDQAEYDNGRRWLSLDLAFGRVGRQHPWWGRLTAAGVPERDLEAFWPQAAWPDVIGVNHYVTSDRFLDHRSSLYPARCRGGNGRETYADTEAVRVDMDPGLTGWEARLREVWQRYGRPIEITEAHLGGPPEEQVRWLMEAWNAALRLRGEGAVIRAVTAWALFGLVDWDSMLRERRGHYEPGAWDARCDPPRGGLLAQAVSSLAQSGRFEHPCLAEPGWWRRQDRFEPAIRRA